MPLILSSDKTRLSQFRGDKSAWPVYLTIGNISKDVRREANSHATILIGYLPVGKFDGFSENAKKVARYRTFHHCMKVITRSLVDAGRVGEKMVCADGFVRWAFPILAAYVADYPEQCLVACCMENRCPMCKVSPELRGAHTPAEPRTKNETIDLLLEKDLRIAAEAQIPVHFTFATQTENLAEITHIYSKDIAFRQCSKFLSDSFDGLNVEFVPVESTSKAAKLAGQQPKTAAICSTIAAKLFDVPVLFDNIDVRHGP